MKHFSLPLVCGSFALVLLTGAPTAIAQSKGAAAPDLGWGSTWLEPGNEQQRREQELLGKINAAQRAHDTSKQLELADQLLALMPNFVAPYVVRAYAHRELKQNDRALTDIDQGLELAQKQSRNDWRVNLLAFRATIYARTKNYASAVNDLQTALKLDGKDCAVLNDLAWLRATVPDAAFRNGFEGVRLAQKAVALSTEHNRYEPIDTLAAAYAESSDYEHAVLSEKRAMTAARTEIKDGAKAQKYQKDAAERLRLFEMHQAYHADAP